MRHRATSLVRVLDRCARCGTRWLPNYDVRRVALTLPTPAGMRHYELVVCRRCERDHPGTPTPVEHAALGCDLENPVEVMEFMQAYSLDPARLVRTARHFLGEDAFAIAQRQAQAVYAARREERARWAEREQEQLVALYTGGDEPSDEEYFHDFDDEESTGDLHD